MVQECDKNVQVSNNHLITRSQILVSLLSWTSNMQTCQDYKLCKGASSIFEKGAMQSHLLSIANASRISEAGGCLQCIWEKSGWQMVYVDLSNALS